MAVKTEIEVQYFGGVEIEGEHDPSPDVETQTIQMRFQELSRCTPGAEYGKWRIDYDTTEAKKIAYAILLAVAEIEGAAGG